MIDWQMVIVVYAIPPLEVIALGISLYLIKKLKARSEKKGKKELTRDNN